MISPGSGENQQGNGPVVVIACRVMEPEIDHFVKEGEGNLEIQYVEQALHRTPGKLLDRVQERIDAVAGWASRIVLGYGLCSNGVVGLTARRQGLYIPRCHDCLSLFLGSPSRYLEIFQERPGTYYLTPGWIAEKNDLIGIMEEHAPRYGRETARWVVEEELKHYTHIALIDTGVGDIAPLRERARENASLLNKRYTEIPGSLQYFRELIAGPYPEDKFLFIPPSMQITQEMFF